MSMGDLPALATMCFSNRATYNLSWHSSQKVDSIAKRYHVGPT